MLSESFRLDPGSIEYLVEQALGLGSDGTVELACSLLRGGLSSEQRLNLADFVRRSAEDPSTRRAFERSTRRLGRCPKNQRAWLEQQLLQRDGARRIVAPTTAADVSGRVDLSDSAWPVDRLPALLDRLGAVAPSVRNVEIRLGAFTYATALAVLAEWIVSRGLVSNHEIECPEEMDEYLERVRFSAALRNREIVVSPDPMDWAVGLTRINRDLPTEAVTEKIVDIVSTFINPDRETREAFHTLIAEMIENVHRHAEAVEDGFAVAQVYPRRLKMGITLVDAGMGVRESLSRGGVAPVSGADDDAEWLRAACRLHVTGKPERHAGYGLYLLSQVVARNRGTFVLSSGRATVVGYRRRAEVAFEAYSHARWTGTIVGAVIDLNRRLPILDVYRDMPAVRGWDDHDLFID